MNDNQLADLKQFIDGRISQSEALLRGEIQEVKGGLQAEIADLRTEMREGFEGVAETIEAVADDIHQELKRHQDQLDDHEAVLHKLRKHPRGGLPHAA